MNTVSQLMNDRYHQLADELAEWALHTTGLDIAEGTSSQQAQVLVHELCTELNLVVPPIEEIQAFVRTTTKVWATTPYIWSVLSSYSGIQTIHDRLERDPGRLLFIIVWAYVLESSVQYLDAHPSHAEEIVSTWREQVMRGESNFGTTFGTIKRASVFASDTTIPADDNDKCALILNANILEACVQDILDQRFSNARNGLAMLGNLFNISTVTSANAQEIPEMALADNWIQLYIVWNLSFCCRFNKLDMLCKLLIPSVAIGTGSKWLRHRVHALRIHLMSKTRYTQTSADWDLGDLRTHLTRHAQLLRPAVSKRGRIFRFVDTVIIGPTTILLTHGIKGFFAMLHRIEYLF